MFLLGLTSPWGLICCKMGQLSQRQQEREQHLLLDPGEHCQGVLECCRGICGTKGVQCYELHQSDQENLGFTSLSVPRGVNRNISEQLYGSPWVPNLGESVPFHGDKGSAGFKADANGI